MDAGRMAGAARIALLALLGAATTLATLDAEAQRSRRATSRADAWIGRDAGDLLMQLRVDGGRVQIQEDDDTGETHYTWSTINPAWTETVYTGGDVIGTVPGARGAPPTPVFSATEEHKVHHPATHRCDITFTADAEGIVSSWRYVGKQCAHDISRPKN